MVLGIFYNLYFFVEARKSEKVEPQRFKVIEQNCWARKNSSIYIEYRGKIYSIRMAKGECSKYPVGSDISLVYSGKNDYFYKQDGLKTVTYKLLFFPIVLLFYIIPWNRFLKKHR